jgi:hypothetical protein
MSHLIGHQLAAEWDHDAHQPRHYHQHQPPKEIPMVLHDLIQRIETAAANAGHAVDDVLHQVLTGHLTASNALAHAGQWVATIEGDPVVQAMEELALGPAGKASLVTIAKEVAHLSAANQPAA